MEIYKRLAEINKRITAIGKNQQNKQQGFQYRGVDDVMNELHSLFAEHEVIILPELINGSREERQSKSGALLITSLNDYRFTFVTVDGSACNATIRGEGMDSGDKSSNKSIAVALKYVLTQMFLIPTNEMKDPDAEVHEPVKTVKKEVKKPEPISKECQNYINYINGATTKKQLEDIGTALKDETGLTANDKSHLREIYKQKEKELK